ncbi:MAG: RNA polymerase-binding protein DksA [Desulfuromonadaceae bacterium]|nr:RNA polymerase-binding protein DksA [Desulfuromonadaceae bacterium]
MVNQFQQELAEEYHPTEDEPYMSPRQLAYFRQKLLQWRAELLAESAKTREQMREEKLRETDLVDQGFSETENAFELRTRDRYRKLIKKIDAALERIDDGSYGFCEETGEEIGIRRLEARPIATMCVEAQERHERMEKLQRIIE